MIAAFKVKIITKPCKSCDFEKSDESNWVEGMMHIFLKHQHYRKCYTCGIALTGVMLTLHENEAGCDLELLHKLAIERLG